MKAQLVEFLRNRGHEVDDCGMSDEDSAACCDYPDIAETVSRKVSEGTSDRGVLVCGTGIGMQIVANKFPGVRAAVCPDELTAEIARRHNDLNVLCLSGDMVSERSLEGIMTVWLDIPFENGRHQRRLNKIIEIEKSLHLR